MRKNIKIILGVFLSLFFLLVAFSKVHWEVFFAQITSLNIGWLLIVELSLLLSMFTRAIRWQVLLGVERHYWRQVWNAACVGYFATAVYPARAGDVLRLLRLQKNTGLPSGLVIGSGMVDRILDGTSLGFLLICLVVIEGLNFHLALGIWLTMFVFFVAVVFVLVLVRHGQSLHAGIIGLDFKQKYIVKIVNWFGECCTGLQVLRSTRVLISILVLQCFVVFFDLFACWLLFYAFSWKLPFLGAISVLVYLAAAISLPSTPGYIGVYQVAAMLALAAYGIGESAAVAYGTVLQILNLLLFVIIGGWETWRGSGNAS